jgi:hypothetical protein
MSYTYSNKRVHPITGAISGRTIEQELTVAELDELPGVYGVQLLDGIIQTTLTVTENVTGGSVFVQVTEPPLAGQVAVRYTSGISPRGLLIFNVADDATNVLVEYEGAGTVSNLENITALASAAAVDEVNAVVPGEVTSQLATIISSDSVLCDTIGTTTGGWGSTDTKVVRFTNVTTTGTAATGASTAANGTTITVNTTGLYHVTGVCRYGVSGSPSLVITVNSSDLTSDPFQTSINGGRLYWQHEGSTGLRNSTTISGLLYLTATDVVRLHGAGTTQALHADWRFELRPIFLG